MKEFIKVPTNTKIPKVIAEVGCNHRGEMDVAKEMVKIAKEFCDADVVKFQKRNSKELLTKEQYSAPHPNPANSYGDTYGAHREFLEFNVDQNRELKEFCESIGIEYSTSVWDLTSAKEMTSFEPKLLKIPSACNNHTEMLEYLCRHFSGEVHVSTGMTTVQEAEDIVSLFEKEGRAKDLVVYACTSGYPVDSEDVCLYELGNLHERFGARVGSIGFSGHHLGISVDVAAVALGAEWIERHFTLDRTWKGTDHAASLEPDGLRRLVRDCRNVHKALSFKENEQLPVELEQRGKLKYRKS